MMSSKASVSLFLLFIMVSCSALQEKQKTNVNDIIKSQEIKKVNQTEILIAGEKIGLNIGQQVQKFGLSTCNFSFAADSVAKLSGADIAFGTSKNIFDKQVSKELWEAYCYSLDQDLPMDPAAQNLVNGDVLFTYPILVDSTITVKCQVDYKLGMLEILIPGKLIVNSID